MADPVLRLDNPRVAVEPGGQAQVVVTITSSSSIVEGFALDVVGADPSQWSEVIPPSVSVFPGEEAIAVVVFSPPPGAAGHSGTFPFGVRARSTEDPAVSAVVEGDITLGKVSGLQAKLVPVTSAGRWRGRHTIQLNNWGNSAVQLQLVASDPDAALGFYLRPDLVDLPIGGNATVRMTVRTRKPFLRGTPVRLPFQVIGQPVGAPPGPQAPSPYGDPSRPVVDGALNQKPILSKAFVSVVALVLVAAIAGGIYLFARKPAAATSLEALGTPDQPKNFTLVATGSDTLKAAWTPIAQISGYELLDVDPADKTTVRGTTPGLSGSLGQTSIAKLAPDTQYCYRLRALRESKTGPASDVRCARTAKAPPSASPGSSTGSPAPGGASSSASPGGASSPPGGGGVPGGGVPGGGTQSSPPVSGASSTGSPTADPLANGAWVVVGGAFPKDSGAALAAATARVKLLQDNGFATAVLLDSQRYAKLQLVTGSPLSPSWLAVVGPYATQPAAQADVGKVGSLAKDTPFVVQPAPPG